MANYAEIATAFVKQYYQTFDADRSQLAPLYVEQSKLSFEGQEHTGREAIITKLASLPFQKVAHVITTVDSQITLDNRILIAVLGQLKTDDDPPHSFFQTFVLGEVGGNLLVMNDVFRLVIHHQ